MTFYPGISFIIPCYNERDSIRACVQSIRDEIVGSMEHNMEIIAVDNGSTDGTYAVLASLLMELKVPFRIVQEPKKGINHARNAGFRVARYDWLAFIDADNTLPKGWLKIAIENAKKDYVAFSGPLRFRKSSFLLQLANDFFYKLARFFHRWVGPTLQGGNYVISKNVMEQMGGHDTSYEFYGEDTRTAQLASQYGKVQLIPELWIWSSSRRFDKQGYVKTTFIYAANYFSVVLFKKNVTKTHKDYR